MSKMMRLCGCVVGVALLLCGAAMAQDYEIKLSRPEKVGNKYQITCSGKQSQSQTVTVAGQPAQKQDDAFQLNFQAIEEILAVSDKGRPTKVSYTIDRAEKVAGEQKTELLAKGKVLIQEYKDGKAQMSVDDKVVAEDVSSALDLAVSDMDPSGPQIEEIIGTKDRQKVGGSWKVDAEGLAKELNKGGKLTIKPEDIAGTCKLASVNNVGGVECLQIECQVAAKNVGMPGMPENVKPEKSEVTFSISGDFPTDGKTASLSQKMTMSLNMAMTAKGDGGEARVVVAVDRSADVKRAPK